MTQNTIPHDKTNWLSQADQRIWFQQCKTNDLEGLKFQQFCQFLQATVYKYFELFPKAPNAQHGETTKFTQQQEMQLFKMFDLRNDHLIGPSEFERMCSGWMSKIYNPASALVVVDVQNDFIDGSLALLNGPAGQDGAEVVPVINSLIDTCNFDSVVYTQDWHPINHIGFHSNLHMRKHIIKQQITSDNVDEKPAPVAEDNGDNHNEQHHKENNEHSTGHGDQAGHCVVTSNDSNEANCKFKLKKLDTKAKVFDVVLFEDGQVEQKLWPTHCVQNSWGAQLHPQLKVVPDAIQIYKGTLEHVDAYSAFWDNMRRNETGLRQELQSKKISDLYFCGLAFDYCVAASAIDSAKAGFVTFVIEDACRGIDLIEIDKRRQEMMDNGVLIVNSNEVKDYLNIRGDHMINGKQNDYWQDPKDASSGQGELSTLKRSLDQELLRDICFKRAILL